MPTPPRLRFTATAILSFLAAGLGLALAVPARGQNTGQRVAPRVGFLYPAGGQQGTKFSVAVGGQNLTGTTAVHFSGTGFSAKVVNYDRPLTQKEINDLREKVQQLQEKRTAAGAAGLSATEQKALNEARAKLATRPNRPANPAIAETVTLEVTLAADATPGDHELRLRGPGGLSNPIAFCVGQLPEIGEEPVIATTQLAQRNRDRKAPALSATLPVLVNGQILPGEVDRVKFAARQGQRLTIVVSARALIPYLADAVPGWFQATLAIFDAKGREVAYADDFRFNPDPVLGYDVPADGEYVLEIKDAIYRGREDFVYRIAIGELPFVTGIFPLGGRTGRDLTFKLTGWNLPSNEWSMKAIDAVPGPFRLSVRQHGQVSNPVRFALDAAPECGDAEPNDCDADAPKLTLPLVINGRIDRPGDEDVFRFTGPPGTTAVAEVVARRLNSPLDSILTATDGKGATLAVNDDYEDKGAGLQTHHADSRVSFTIPADGTFILHLRDTQRLGGEDYAYRLRVDAPRPDFALRVVPASINVRAGGTVPVTVYALRRDGFAGEITVGMIEAPRGFALSGGRIPAHQDKVQLTLTAVGSPSDQPIDLAFAGQATIDGQRVVHRAVPAEDMMQAFAYRHLVPARELKVAVVGRTTLMRVTSRLPVEIPLSGAAHVRVVVPGARSAEKLHLEPFEAPEGFTVTAKPVGAEQFDVVISCDPAKVKAGAQGNLLLNATAERVGGVGSKKGRPQRTPMGFIPAIPFEVTAAPSRLSSR